MLASDACRRRRLSRARSCATRPSPSLSRGDPHRGERHRNEGSVNENHLQMLASPRWAQVLRQHVLPWLESVGELGDDVLEVGPGPGLTTDLLLTLTARITAVEVDAGLAAQLARRLTDGNVEVINASAERTG